MGGTSTDGNSGTKKDTECTFWDCSPSPRDTWWAYSGEMEQSICLQDTWSKYTQKTQEKPIKVKANIENKTWTGTEKVLKYQYLKKNLDALVWNPTIFQQLVWDTC